MRAQKILGLLAAASLLAGQLAGAGPALAQPKPAPPEKPGASTEKPKSGAAATPGAAAQEDEEGRILRDPAKREEAEGHFRRGLTLLQEEAWAAALAEFLRSRELFPTRTAVNNAAYCLRKLKRFDESLDLYELMLREYPKMPDDRRDAAFKEVAELREMVGTIDITGAEPGAAIAVDGKARQSFPLIDPLRVSAGTHTVRLFKEGFEPFEQVVDVAGGQTVRVSAKMPTLQASGRLIIKEKTGKRLDVLVNGAIVGVTPWEGTVATGEHVVVLRGDGDLGAVPTRAPVTQNETTSMTLVAEALESALLIDVKPTGASLLIDGVPVGRGVWEGRLKQGAHKIEAQYGGFFTKRQELSLGRGEERAVTLTLERDDDADEWRAPSRINLDISGGLAISPGFGGDVGSSCGEGCGSNLGLGGLVMLAGSYEFGSGFNLGLSAGFLQASQAYDARPATLTPVGIDPGLQGTVDDDIRLRGYLIGLEGGMRFFDETPLRLSLGAGAMIAQTRDARSGVFATRNGTAYRAPEVATEQVGAFVYLDPEVSIGFRVLDFLELGAGLHSLILIAVAPTAFAGDDAPSFVAAGDGLSQYDSNEETVGHMIVLVPSLVARAIF